MSGIQRFLIAILPKRWAESMEAESRRWMIRCDCCHSERSVWDAGGIRWKAAGSPKQRMPCPTCGKVCWHTLYKIGSAPSQGWMGSVEAESRQWMIRCEYCHFERSVWDAGGVRWKAAGTSKQLKRCPECGRVSWHTVYKKPAIAPEK